MKKVLLLSGLTPFLLVLTVHAETAAFKASYFECNGMTSTVKGHCPEKVANKVNGPFNFGLWNNSVYDVETVWLRAKLNGEDQWQELNKHTGNMTNGDGSADGASALIFEFNEQWLMDRMHAGDASLKGGFTVRLKIKSVGLGSGREDKCHPAQVKYDFDHQRWVWRKDSKDATWHAIEDNTLYLWRTGGTVNDVRCGLKNVGGEKIAD